MRKKISILGVICLALILVALPFMACAEEAPAPVTPAPVTPAPAPPVTPAPAPVVVPAPASTAGPELFTVLDPRGIDPERPIYALSPRLDTLVGKHILVINFHGGNEAAMVSVAPALQAAIPGCDVEYYYTEGGLFVGVTDNDWAKIETADGIILGHNF